MQRSAWLLVVGLGLSLLAAGVVPEWHAASVQAALQDETTVLTQTPYPPPVRSSSSRPSAPQPGFTSSSPA